MHGDLICLSSVVHTTPHYQREIRTLTYPYCSQQIVKPKYSPLYERNTFAKHIDFLYTILNVELESRGEKEHDYLNMWSCVIESICLFCHRFQTS